MANHTKQKIFSSKQPNIYSFKQQTSVKLHPQVLLHTVVDAESKNI